MTATITAELAFPNINERYSKMFYVHVSEDPAKSDNSFILQHGLGTTPDNVRVTALTIEDAGTFTTAGGRASPIFDLAASIAAGEIVWANSITGGETIDTSQALYFYVKGGTTAQDFLIEIGRRHSVPR